MQSKLTLRLDECLIEKAKIYAKNHGKSLSQIVSDYFYFLQQEDTKTDQEDMPMSAAPSPITESLVGILKKGEVHEDDYKKFLEEKYL